MKKKLKIGIIFFGVLTLLILIFRNPIFYACVEYRNCKSRTEQKLTNQQLIDYIEQEAVGKKLNSVEDIIDFSQKLTAKKLTFSLSAKISDPNLLFDTNEANCIGYAKFSSAVCNYLFEKQQLIQYKAIPMVAKIYLFGKDVHQCTNNSYFRDHDFVTVINYDNKSEISFDSSLYDYLGISRVNKNIL